MSLPNFDTISEEEHFYGYLYGVRAEIDDEGDNGTFHADFYYDGERRSYKIPDFELYELLVGNLGINAFEIFENRCLGVGKLWITRKKDGWRVDLP